MQALVNTFQWSLSAVDKWLKPLVMLVVRIFIAYAFFKSGLLKIKDWDSTIFLFQYEYVIPFIPYNVAAVMGTIGELVLPTLLALGLAGRIGAFGLLIMTVVIETFVYPGTQEHYYWMSILGLLVVTGPGLLSVDTLIRKHIDKD
ncbi:DoxX family protein [Hahella ganghwensis]|uniref:DoxX family protein n=1 Tax=Hahella ganghwensis TaxID=286420 RepID=UPI0003820746|nr:DoxX family protein [Hahella ganghwensis]